MQVGLPPSAIKTQNPNSLQALPLLTEGSINTSHLLKKIMKSKTIALHIPPGVLLGAHTSTSGGVSQAIGRAQACGFTAAQIFVKNNKQWFAPPLAEAEITQFLSLRKASGIYFFAHNSYLVNLA